MSKIKCFATGSDDTGYILVFAETRGKAKQEAVKQGIVSDFIGAQAMRYPTLDRFASEYSDAMDIPVRDQVIAGFGRNCDSCRFRVCDIVDIVERKCWDCEENGWANWEVCKENGLESWEDYDEN